MAFLWILRDERLHFVGLGLAAISLIQAMRWLLEAYTEDVIIQPTEPKTQYITQDTEDALKLPTLNSLLGHYNTSIRDLALKIVASRGAHDPTVINTIMQGITQKDYDTRTKNLRALKFITEERDLNGPDPFLILHNAHAYKPLVRCLELCLEDVEHEPLDDPSFDDYWVRDSLERWCLTIICLLIRKLPNGVERLVEAKFVEKWLAKQLWGDTDETRMKNFDTYIQRKKNRITDICWSLKSSKIGSKALVSAKLSAKSKRRRHQAEQQYKVVVELSIANDADMGALEVGNTAAELIPRVVDQSVEEQRLRRRHREAIVINDGTHTLGRGDIIEREHDSNG